jgi:hypothetical protein
MTRAPVGGARPEVPWYGRLVAGLAVAAILAGTALFIAVASFPS